MDGVPLRFSLRAEMYAESSIHALSKAPGALGLLTGGGLIVETSAGFSWGAQVKPTCLKTFSLPGNVLNSTDRMTSYDVHFMIPS
jgi:hypothetical protein